MKKQRICLVGCFACTLLSSILNSCNQPGASGKNADSSVDTFSYPFKATYSSNVAISSHPEYLSKVLTIWKMFETKQIGAMKQYFTDTVTYEDASGYTFHGLSDSLLEFARKDVEGLDSLRFDISVWENVHLNDRNEDWVYIWAAERRYPKNDKADTSLIQEQWKITDGRVSFFNQLKGQTPR
jgi:hypothetical protein